MNKCVACAVIVLLLVAIFSAGCIKLVQKNLDLQPAEDSPRNSDLPANTPSPRPIASSLAGQTVTESSLASSVSSIDPIYPVDPYRTIRNLTGKNGEMATLPVQDSWSSLTPLYTLHYSPRYDARAVQVNVTKGPLVIIVDARPKISEPRVSFADVTVRTLPSKGIVTEEHIDHYMASDPDPGSTTGIIESGDPNVRQIVIFTEGLYHINVYGNQVDVDMKVFTGDSPVKTGGAGLVPVSADRAEDEVWA